MGLPVEPGHDPFVLEVELQRRALVLVDAVEARPAAQETLGGAAFDVDHLAPIEDLARLDREDGRDRVFVLALGLAHGMADGDRLGGGAVDAPLLHLGAGARRLAGRRDRAVLDADLAADPLHPFPGRHLLDHRFEAAHIDGGERTGLRDRRPRPRSSAPRDRRGPSCRESITGRFRCAAAISGWIEFPPPISSDMIPRNLWPVCSLHQLDGAGDGAAVGQPLLADQRRAHVGDRGDPVVVQRARPTA